MLEHRIFRDPAAAGPRVLAVFSYRYDAHLVPDLLTNIRPSVHGYVAWDDRDAGAALSDEPTRRNALLAEARRLGADWILAVDPDERFEDALANRMPQMLAMGQRKSWLFNLREMFAPNLYRSEGLWGAKRLVRLFPTMAASADPQVALHGSWVAEDKGLTPMLARINLYHLRMASPVRRRFRRALYAAADPLRAFQKLGYDYLDDDRGMALEPIDPTRAFSPAFVEDNGLWAPDPGEIGPIRPDPYEVRIFRAAASARQCGHLSAHYQLQDLAQDSPQDADLGALSARFALLAGASDLALAEADKALQQQPDDLHARLIATSALIQLGRDAEAALSALRAAAPGGPLIEALGAAATRATADFTAPTAQWRRWVTGKASCAEGMVPNAEMAVVVIGYQAQPGLLPAVQSLLEQDEMPEIVVVNTGGGEPARLLAPVLARIRLITVDAPMYVGAARNIGVDASRAPWVAFLAGDCTARPGWVSGRMARHRAGAQSVATAVVEQPAPPLSALAANRLRYSSRHPLTEMREVSFYGQSYCRSLLAAAGAFPVGLAVNEDTVLNDTAARIAAPVWAPDVQTGHRDPADLASLLRDERLRGQRRADHPPFRNLVDQPDHARAIAPAMDTRLAAAWRLVDRDPSLTPTERRAVKATQWLASLADRRGVVERMAQLAKADTIFACAEAEADPAAALQDARRAQQLDPQNWRKAHLAGQLYAATGDITEAEKMLRQAVALGPAQPAAVVALTRLIATRDGPDTAWRFAETAALAAPSERRLWENAAEMAVAAGHPAWAVALGLIGLAQGFDRPAAHHRMANLHDAAANPMAAAFRNVTATRLQRRLGENPA